MALKLCWTGVLWPLVCSCLVHYSIIGMWRAIFLSKLRNVFPHVRMRWHQPSFFNCIIIFLKRIDQIDQPYINHAHQHRFRPPLGAPPEPKPFMFMFTWGTLCRPHWFAVLLLTFTSKWPTLIISINHQSYLYLNLHRYHNLSLPGWVGAGWWPIFLYSYTEPIAACYHTPVVDMKRLAGNTSRALNNDRGGDRGQDRRRGRGGAGEPRVEQWVGRLDHVGSHPVGWLVGWRGVYSWLFVCIT